MISFDSYDEGNVHRGVVAWVVLSEKRPFPERDIPQVHPASYRGPASSEYLVYIDLAHVKNFVVSDMVVMSLKDVSCVFVCSAFHEAVAFLSMGSGLWSHEYSFMLRTSMSTINFM